LKRILASVFLTLGMGGMFAFAAPVAHADGPLEPIVHKLTVIVDPSSVPCVALHVYVHGTPVIETGYPGICL